jgi:hypothetical protein
MNIGARDARRACWVHVISGYEAAAADRDPAPTISVAWIFNRRKGERRRAGLRARAGDHRVIAGAKRQRDQEAELRAQLSCFPPGFVPPGAVQGDDPPDELSKNHHHPYAERIDPPRSHIPDAAFQSSRRRHSRSVQERSEIPQRVRRLTRRRTGPRRPVPRYASIAQSEIRENNRLVARPVGPKGRACAGACFLAIRVALDGCHIEALFPVTAIAVIAIDSG